MMIETSGAVVMPASVAAGRAPSGDRGHRPLLRLTPGNPGTPRGILFRVHSLRLVPTSGASRSSRTSHHGKVHGTPKPEGSAGGRRRARPPAARPNTRRG